MKGSDWVAGQDRLCQVARKYQWHSFHFYIMLFSLFSLLSRVDGCLKLPHCCLWASVETVSWDVTLTLFLSHHRNDCIVTSRRLSNISLLKLYSPSNWLFKDMILSHCRGDRLAFSNGSPMESGNLQQGVKFANESWASINWNALTSEWLMEGVINPT